jgi:hypothetical protein
MLSTILDNKPIEAKISTDQSEFFKGRLFDEAVSVGMQLDDKGRPALQGLVHGRPDLLVDQSEAKLLAVEVGDQHSERLSLSLNVKHHNLEPPGLETLGECFLDGFSAVQEDWLVGVA